MGKAITFSFTSTEFEGTEATETFIFEKLGIDKKLDEKEIEIEIDRIFQSWVWNKLNISSSIVIEELDAD